MRPRRARTHGRTDRALSSQPPAPRRAGIDRCVLRRWLAGIVHAQRAIQYQYQLQYQSLPHRAASHRTPDTTPRVAYHTLRSEPAAEACPKAGSWVVRLLSKVCGRKIRVRLGARLGVFSLSLAF